MSDKRYPTRMHEVLGVELGEEATYKSGSIKIDFFVDEFGSPRCDNNRVLYGHELARIINNPERITRRPRLTEEQVRHLKGLYLLGFRWIERDEHDALVAWENYDDKADVFQNDFLPLSYRSYQVLIVVPTRNAPLNIVQTLRDAGVEVEG